MTQKQGILNLYKKAGETPLERLARFRQKNPEYKDITLTYAGRLDPMAEGVLVVLAGDEGKSREKYLGLSKEYIFEVLFGFSTDTYDLLGKVTTQGIPAVNLEEKIKNYIHRFEGKVLQEYPPYSSKPVQGKPLFEWARSNRLDEIQIPIKEVEIYSLEIVSTHSISCEILKEKIIENISKVRGDFRQKEILSLWDFVLKPHQHVSFPVYEMKIVCSSGTYVRGIANSLGKEVLSGALALRIMRTKVGEHSIEDSIL